MCGCAHRFFSATKQSVFNLTNDRVFGPHSVQLENSGLRIVIMCTTQCIMHKKISLIYEWIEYAVSQHANTKLSPIKIIAQNSATTIEIHAVSAQCSQFTNLNVRWRMIELTTV